MGLRLFEKGTATVLESDADVERYLRTPAKPRRKVKQKQRSVSTGSTFEGQLRQLREESTPAEKLQTSMRSKAAMGSIEAIRERLSELLSNNKLGTTDLVDALEALVKDARAVVKDRKTFAPATKFGELAPATESRRRDTLSVFEKKLAGLTGRLETGSPFDRQLSQLRESR